MCKPLFSLLFLVFPNFSKKLEDTKVKANTPVTFSGKAFGSGILQYDWFKNGQRINITR